MNIKKRLCLKDTHGKFYLNLEDIVRLQADDCYTVIYVLDNKKYIQSGSLCKFHERLKEEGGFLRIHKSHVINLMYVFRIDNCGSVTMMDGTMLPITDEARKEIEKNIPGC
jgi:two-component system, LytTR family, response regulator